MQGEYWRSILPTKLVATATSLVGSKKYFSSFIYGQSSTILQISCNIGLVDAEIIGLIDTNHYRYLKTTAKQKPSSPARAERVR